MGAFGHEYFIITVNQFIAWRKIVLWKSSIVTFWNGNQDKELEKEAYNKPASLSISSGRSAGEEFRFQILIRREILTALEIGHARGRDAVRIHDRVIVDTTLGMAGQAFFVEHIPLRRCLFRHSRFCSLLFPASAVHKVALLWVFLDVFFLFRVDLFQFGLEIGQPGIVAVGGLELLDLFFEV